MRDLIRHILQESNVKTELMGVIQDEDIFAAADLVGGINHLRRIFNDDTKITDTIDSLKGTLNLIYHSLKEYLEFPMRFEIVGKGENVFKNNSWPIVNLIYDDSNLSNDEKKFFEQFVYDTIGDLNIDIIDIKPEALKMFRERNGYIHIKYVNGRDWESLDHEIQPEDNDMRNIHRELYTKSDINESKILQENEEDPTKKILNFLRRRSEVEEKNLGGDEYPINFKILRIYIGDGTWDSITRFENKKEQVKRILNILMDNRIIDRFEFNETRYNSYAQQAIRAVKTFLNQVMGDKSNITESKIVDKIKSFLGNKPLTKDDKLINAIVEFINENYSIDFELVDYEMTFYLTTDNGSWIFPPIMEYYPKYKKLHYSWKFAEDIHTWIGDNRLLQPDSEMMGKIFEKLFDKKVVEVYGYSRL